MHFRVLVSSAFLLFTSTLLLAQSFVLKPEDVGATTGGCVQACIDAGICSSTATGNAGPFDITQEISVPADMSVNISVTTNNCATASGFDSGDQLSVDGNVVFTGSNNAQVDYNVCLNNVGPIPRNVPVTLRVNRRDESVTVNYTFQPVDAVNCSFLVLPVKLSYWTAETRSSQVFLHWETTQEINNNYFQLQRSVDSKTWTDYGDKIEGHGTTDMPQRYAFVDQQPLPGVSFYRLQQTDYDGTEHFHPVERVDMRKAADITVFPNPAHGTVYLVPPAESTSAAHIRISTLYGQLVRTINAQNGTNELHLADLLPGQYLIEWIDDHATYRKSLIVR